MGPGHLIFTSTSEGLASQVSPRARPAPHSPARSTAALLDVGSPVRCLRSAFVTTLGTFTFSIVSSGVFVYFLAVLPPGQVSQLSCPGAGYFSNLPAAAASPQTGQLRGDVGPHLLPADPHRAPVTGFCLAESNVLSQAEAGCGGKSEVHLLRQGCVFREHRWGPFPSLYGSCRLGFMQRQDLPTSRRTGVLTWDDKALFVNMPLICNFENKIETSCILKYKMKCDALYTI